MIFKSIMARLFPSLNYFHSSIIMKMCPWEMKINSIVKRLFFSTWTYFPPTENKFAHHIMTKDPNKYVLATNDLVLEKNMSNDVFEGIFFDWENATSSEIVEYFKILTEHSCKENFDFNSKMFSLFFFEFERRIESLSENHLELVLKYLNNLTNSLLLQNKGAAFTSLYNSLDKTLINRMKNWDSDKLLLFADYIYCSKLSKELKYTKMSLDILSSRQLTSEQIVQSLFYVSTVRNKPSNMLALEKSFNQHLNTLNTDEIAICCMGFFKSKTRFMNSTIVEKLMEKVIAEANAIKDISLAAILKMIRYSTNKRNVRMTYMLDSLVKEIPRLSFLACVHVALVGTSNLTVHRSSLMAIHKKLIESPSSARLKDLERLTFVLSLFDIESDTSLYEIILAELRSPNKKEEIINHGSCLANCVSYLSLKDIFPHDLISQVLHSDFIAKHYRDNLIGGRALIVLDSSVEIECERYTGNRLNTKTKNYLIPMFQEHIPDAANMQNLNFNQKFTLEVMRSVENIRGGKEYTFNGHILPHFSRGDIVILDGLNGKPLEVSKHYSNVKPGSILRPPNTTDKWIAIVIAGRQCTTTNTGELLANTKMKLRQLSKIGYRPVVVSWAQWRILKSAEQKENYLKYLITTSYHNPKLKHA